MASSPRTYTGVLHVHTVQSGGYGTLEEVVEAAKKNEVDFVVLTDHGTLGYGLENQEGWHDGVLVLCGEEVSTPTGHLLAFESREEIGKRETVEEALEEIRRQCAVSVSIHHQLPRGKSPNPRIPPPPVPMEQTDLLEIWSFMDEFLSRTNSKYVLQAAARAEKMLLGPNRKLLWKWDRELERRRLPIVGGLNVHQRKDPLLDWKVLFPYDLAFQTICTCIHTQELPTVWLRARDMVWSALREGRSHVANRVIASEKGFQFEFVSVTGRRRAMGEDVAYTPNGRFHICLPQPAEVVLRHNGQPLFWGTSSETSFPAAGPGSYRVEVYLNRKLWILSNPIRLIDEEGVLQPTVSDVT